MLKKIISVVVLTVMLFSFGGCRHINPTESHKVRDGAYFSTGKGNEFAVIYKNYISLLWDSKNNRFDVYEFSEDGDSYVAKSARSDIRFNISGDNLTITLKELNGSKKINLKCDKAIEVSEEDPIQLDVPNIDKFVYNELEGEHDTINWGFEEGRRSCIFLHQNGILGASVEIKHENSNDFIAEKIVDYIPEPYCIFGVLFKDLDLTQGGNALRIKHIGGPFIDANNKIRLSLDSEPIYFNVTVNSDGTVISSKIQ